jgi:hypothetical protein
MRQTKREEDGVAADHRRSWNAINSEKTEKV